MMKGSVHQENVAVLNMCAFKIDEAKTNRPKRNIQIHSYW